MVNSGRILPTGVGRWRGVARQDLPVQLDDAFRNRDAEKKAGPSRLTAGGHFGKVCPDWMFLTGNNSHIFSFCSWHYAALCIVPFTVSMNSG